MSTYYCFIMCDVVVKCKFYIESFFSKVISYLLWHQSMDVCALMSAVVGTIFLVWTRSTKCGIKVGNIGLKFSSFSKELFTSALHVFCLLIFVRRSQWPRGLRRMSAAVRLLRLLVRIPSEAWMFVSNVACFQRVISATSRSLAQRNAIGSDASV